MTDAADSLETRVGGRLRAIRDAQLLRTLHPPTGIDFSSNDYLGLAGHPVLKRAMIGAVEAHGCGSTGSRLLRGEREAFSAVERKFAAFKRTERALYFSSGYLANLAVLTTLPEDGDVIFSDERNHASLIDGARLSAANRVVVLLDTSLNGLPVPQGKHAAVSVEQSRRRDGLADTGVRAGYEEAAKH